MNEIWKDIEGYEGLYQISNLGRVKSLNYNKRGFERILKNKTGSRGYFNVNLSKDGKSKNINVHRIVATHFIPNPDNLPQVNHKDENKQNNCVENLEWCTAEYNNTYGSRLEKSANSKSIPIIQFTKDWEFVRKWNSARIAEYTLGLNIGSVCLCLKGKHKSTGGYKWGYAEDYERIPFKVFDLEIYRKKVA